MKCLTSKSKSLNKSIHDLQECVYSAFRQFQMTQAEVARHVVVVLFLMLRISKGFIVFVFLLLEISTFHIQSSLYTIIVVIVEYSCISANGSIDLNAMYLFFNDEFGARS